MLRKYGSWMLLCNFLLFTGSYSLAAPPFDASAAANESKATVQQYAGDKKKLQTNLTGPLVSQGSMTAFNGKTFNGAIDCPASASPFLKIFAQPSSSGDISYIQIQHDTNNDGSYDNTYALQTRVSGVCANGVISCNAGSWENCQAYKWNYSGEKLGLQMTGLPTLGACYCINNHCGNGLVWNNLGTVLGDIGGGAIAKIGEVSPMKAIARTEIVGPEMSFYGSDINNCQTIVAASSDKKKYYSSQGSDSALLTDAYSAADTLTGDAKTIYDAASTVTGKAAAVINSCAVRRNVALEEVTIDDIITYRTGAGGVRKCAGKPGCLELTFGVVGDNYWAGTCDVYTHNASFFVNLPHRIKKATLVKAQFDDWLQLNINNTIVWTGPPSQPPWLNPTGLPPTATLNPANNKWYCELSSSWNIAPNFDFTSVLKKPGQVDAKVRVAVSGNGEGYLYAQVDVDDQCLQLPDVVENGCTALETNPDCRLLEEVADITTTVNKFVSTGLKPQPNTRTIDGKACSKTVTRPWWELKRKYSCKLPQKEAAFDLSNALKRNAHLKENFNEGAYEDTQLQKDGSWKTQTAKVVMPPALPQVGPCTLACKTRKPRGGSTVGLLGASQDQRATNEQGWNYSYYECAQNNVCPMGAGEQLVTACQCLNQFSEATSAMQLIRLANKDMICTYDTPSNL